MCTRHAARHFILPLLHYVTFSLSQSAHEQDDAVSADRTSSDTPLQHRRPPTHRSDPASRFKAQGSLASQRHYSPVLHIAQSARQSSWGNERTASADSASSASLGKDTPGASASQNHRVLVDIPAQLCHTPTSHNHVFDRSPRTARGRGGHTPAMFSSFSARVALQTGSSPTDEDSVEQLGVTPMPAEQITSDEVTHTSTFEMEPSLQDTSQSITQLQQ